MVKVFGGRGSTEIWNWEKREDNDLEPWWESNNENREGNFIYASSKNSTLDVESAEEARREEGGVSGNSLCDEIDRQEETEEEASY